jgi:adenylate kinase
VKRNIILVGAPGSGKGTQAQLLIRDLGLVQISTGDILRAAVKAGTELGQKAKGYMDAGQLVPDELIIGLIRERMAQDDVKSGVILDGFPRTLPQAEALDRLLEEVGEPLSRVIAIDVPVEVIKERITGRRSCRNCGAVYHVEFNPPPESGACGRCGASDLYQRDDDREDKVSVRLDAYAAQTEKVIPYYADQGLVAHVDGNQSPEDVYAAVRREVEAAG